MEHMDHIWSVKVKIGFRLCYRALKQDPWELFSKIIKLWKFTLVISYPTVSYGGIPTYKFHPKVIKLNDRDDILNE